MASRLNFFMIRSLLCLQAVAATLSDQFSSLLSLQAVAPTLSDQSFNLRPFTIDLSRGVPRMMELIKNTQLPEKPQYPGVEIFFGIELDVLKSLRENWLNDFDWEKEQAYLNRLVNHPFRHNDSLKL